MDLEDAGAAWHVGAAEERKGAKGAKREQSSEGDGFSKGGAFS